MHQETFHDGSLVSAQTLPSVPEEVSLPTLPREMFLVLASVDPARFGEESTREEIAAFLSLWKRLLKEQPEFRKEGKAYLLRFRDVALPLLLSRDREAHAHADEETLRLLEEGVSRVD